MIGDLGVLLDGVPMTLALTAVSFVVGALLGLPLLGLSTARHRTLRVLAATIILTCRSIPPIVWLFIIFFGIGFGYIQLDPFTAGSIGLGLITGANMAEIYRGALAAIHSGQWEAATVLNLNRYHRFIDVIGPQLLRVALPSAATYAIGLLKDTAVASAIGVHEIAFQAHHLSQQTFRGLDIFAGAALLYILASVPIALLARWTDQRLRAKVAL
jgi:polar amino acid transport system permease protein